MVVRGAWLVIKMRSGGGAKTGKADEAAHASFGAYVAREMGKAEALLKVVGSRPENLVDNFFTLMPAGLPADFQRILELKARLPPWDARWHRSQTSGLCLRQAHTGQAGHSMQTAALLSPRLIQALASAMPRTLKESHPGAPD